MARYTLLSATLLVLALPVAGLAQDRGADFFAQWDADADGSVSAAELQTRRDDIFTMFDAEGDGSLGDSDLIAMAETVAAQEDTKRAEKGMAAPMGQGQGKGLGQGQGKGLGQGLGQGQGQGQGQGKGLGAGRGMGRGGPGQTLHDAMTLAFNDADGDGQVSRAEFAAASAVVFQALDRDGSGGIDASDLR